MADAQHESTDRGVDQGSDQGGSSEPFRASGSGADYDPAGSWGAERRLDGPSGGAGDGGYGPEGDYGGTAGAPNADVIGEVHGDVTPLVDEAQQLGRPQADRMWVGGNAPDAGGEPPRDDARR